MSMKIVIRAGGIGSRLWPVSREKKPKQFHALTSTKTMLEEAIERACGLVDPSDIYISTQQATATVVQEQKGEVPTQNIIIEPERKDTAAAIGLESIIIAHSDPDAVVASIGSDHSVRRVEEFQRMLRIAEEFVTRHPDTIIPIGIRASRADIGYGYIECGDVIDTFQGKNLWKVNRFTEKPDLQEAKQFVSQANYLWNANMFVWKVGTILQLYKKHLPEMYAQLQEIATAIGTPQQQETIDRVYPSMEKIAIDYAIIEKADRIAAMAADIGWSDIGDWTRLKDELSEMEQDNVVINAEHMPLKTTNTLVYTEHAGKLVATIGVDNLIIVDTENALLVADKYHSAEVKDVVKKLQDRNKHHLL